MKKNITATVLFLIISVISFGQEWTVPADRKDRLSPFQFNDSIRKAGLKIYSQICITCHGSPGMGNFQPLTPPPGDPATTKIQHNSDGEIFYKVSEGRGPMPSFKNSLAARDIWNVIAYLRSFNTAYVQKVMPEITSNAYPGAVISLYLQLNTAKDSVQVRVLATTDTHVVPVEKAGLKLFLKRTFGQFMLDEEKFTDEKGIASFAIPSGLPGDTAGNLQVSARFSDEDLFGSASRDTLIQAGIKVVPVSLVSERAMWNIVQKAPLWILLTYILGVLLVWGFIFLVLFKLRDIFIIGEHLEKVKEEQKTQ
jgi:hypothetical protein